MKLLWTKSAVSDLENIRQFVEQEDPSTAQKMGLLILESVEQLAQFPESGRYGRVKGTRELVIPGTPYFIPYRIKRESIQLLRVMHGRQDYR